MIGEDVEVSVQSTHLSELRLVLSALLNMRDQRMLAVLVADSLGCPLQKLLWLHLWPLISGEVTFLHSLGRPKALLMS